LQVADQHQKELAAYENQKNAILQDQKLTGKQRNKQIGRLPRKPEWIRNQAVAWGGFPSQLVSGVADPVADLAIGQLKPFDASWTKV
jgi:hypothetical protein